MDQLSYLVPQSHGSMPYRSCPLQYGRVPRQWRKAPLPHPASGVVPRPGRGVGIVGIVYLLLHVRPFHLPLPTPQFLKLHVLSLGSAALTWNISLLDTIHNATEVNNIHDSLEYTTLSSEYNIQSLWCYSVCNVMNNTHLLHIIDNCDL